jgi:hypothetical protein
MLGISRAIVPLAHKPSCRNSEAFGFVKYLRDETEDQTDPQFKLSYLCTFYIPCKTTHPKKCETIGAAHFMDSELHYLSEVLTA